MVEILASGEEFKQVKAAGRHNFKILWSSTVMGDFADGLFQIALPLLATRYTDSAMLVAGVAFLLYLPWLLFGLFVGVLIDRADRKKVFMWANLLRVVSLAALVLSVTTGLGVLPVLYSAAFLLGVAETLADTAASSILPAIVPVDNLEKANARLIGGQTVVSNFAGPLVGGTLVSVSMTLAIGLSGALYGLALLVLLWLYGNFKAARTATTTIRADLKEGVQYLLRHRLFRALILMVGVMNLVWSAWTSVLVLYVVAPGPGGLNEFGYGLLLTAMGVGGLGGALLVEPVRKKLGRRWAIGADLAGTFLMAAVPLLTTNPWLIGAAAFFGGVGAAMWSVTVMAVRQRLVPDYLLGRVSGAIRLVSFGSFALGSLLAGLIAQFASIPVVFGITALLTALLVVPFWREVTSEALAGETPEPAN